MNKNEAIEFLITKLEQDEPVFILRGRDCLGPYVISKWIMLARDRNVDRSKIDSAEKVFLEFLNYFPVRLPD